MAFYSFRADHDDQDVVLFNRTMLPSYYGLLHLACRASRSFMRQLSAHQNIMWAFKNIAPYQIHYPQAQDQLLKIMRLMASTDGDCTPEERQQALKFKQTTLDLFLTSVESKTNWQTFVA